MSLSRRRLLGSAALLGLASACAPAPATTPAAAPARPPEDPAALVDWIAAHRDRVSLLVDDGRGAAFAHDADRQRPIASAAKVMHLVAYAQAVVAGRLDPAAPVTVEEWERWYVPGTDGFGHPNALKQLGVAAGGSVTWDDLAAVMIDVSDSAVPDLLRATLGDDALGAAAAAGGWTAPDLPAFGGQGLLAPAPFGTGALPPDTPAGPQRRAQEWAALRSYAADPAQRAEAARRAAAAGITSDGLEPLFGWCAGTATGSATQLAGIHRAIATAAVGEPVAAIARRHLGRVLAPKVKPPVVEYGQKGGNLPGLITNAFTVRRDDGTVGVSVLSLSGVAAADYQAMGASGSPLVLSQKALLDDGVRDRLRGAVGAA